MIYSQPDPRLQALRNAHNELIDLLVLARQSGDRGEVERLKIASDATFEAYWAAKGGMPQPIRSVAPVDGVVQKRRGRPPGVKNGQGKRAPEPVKRKRGRPKGSKNKVKK